MIRIIKRILIILLLILCICNFTHVNAGQLQNSINGAQNFVSGSTAPAIINSQAVYDVLNTFYGILLAIGIVAAVIQGIYIGIRIIWGSIEQQVKARELIIPYLWIVAAIGFGNVVIRAFLKIFMDVVT